MPKVLVVDDNRPSRELICDIVRLMGIEASAASDGISGLKAARAIKPDLVILDLSMPGMDGFEVLQQLRADPESAATPVLAVTANATPRSRTNALLAGFSDFITKPLRTADLRRRVEACLNGSSL